MDQISNVATQADYTDLLTLGPSNYDAISVNVWNNSCVSQTFELGPGGDYQTGQWGSESLEAANSTFQLGNCGGVRFKTNPDTPGTPARIIAYAWKSGDVQKVGGIQLSGALLASGGVTPMPDVKAGTQTLTFPGGSGQTGAATISHGLSGTPSGVACAVVTPPGATFSIIPYADIYTATTFRLYANTGDGTTPGAGATVVVAWVAST